MSTFLGRAGWWLPQRLTRFLPRRPGQAAVREGHVAAGELAVPGERELQLQAADDGGDR